ncbi:MAG: hypothetical protein ABIG71_00575 [Candidatus Uhrbacteria bacterium]
MDHPKKPTETVSITLHPNNTAVFSRRLSLIVDGNPEERELDRKRVALASFESDGRDVFHILPNRCRGFRMRDGRTIVIVEDQPRTKLVRWLTDGDAYKPMRRRLCGGGVHRLWDMTPDAFAKHIAAQQEFEIALPYLVWCYQFDGGRFTRALLYYRTAPIRSGRDELLIPNMPNRKRDNHELCITRAVRDVLPMRDLSIAEAIEFVEDEFWGSAWNADWCDEFLVDAERMPEVASPWEWARTTATVPTFPIHAPWRSADTTIEEVIDRLLNDGVRQPDLFARYCDRISVADVWDGDAAAVHEIIPVSTAKQVVLMHHTIRVGDLVTLTVGRWDECSDGGTFPIEWFGTALKGTRYVKLVGIEDPILLIEHQRVADYASIESGEHEDITSFDGVPITIGTLCCFTDQALWPNRRNDCYYRITEARRDLDGATLVRFDREEHGYGLTVISDSEQLFPGVRLLPPEDLDAQGFLSARNYILGDGTELKVGDDIAYHNGRGVSEVRIRAFYGLRTGDQGRSCSTNGGALTLERFDGSPCGNILRGSLRSPVSECTVGRQTVRINDAVRYDRSTTIVLAFSHAFPDGRQFVHLEGVGWRLFVRDGMLDPHITIIPTINISRGGELAEVDGVQFHSGMKLRHRESGEIVEVRRFHLDSRRGLFFVETTDMISMPLMENYEWHLEWFEICDKITIARGLVVRSDSKLRLTVAIGASAVGSEHTVSQVLRELTGVHHVVFDDNSGFTFTGANAQCFECYHSGREAWVALPATSDAYTHDTNRQSTADGATLHVGMRVRYLGGDDTTLFAEHEGSEQTAMDTPAFVVTCDRHTLGEGVLIRFDVGFPGCYDESGCGSQRECYIHPKYLTSISGDSIVENGWTWYGPHSDGVVALDTLSVINPGELIGRDVRDRMVISGQTVHIAEWSHSRQLDELRRAIPGAMAKLYRVVFGGDGFVYLDVGQAVRFSSRAEVPLYDDVPILYRLNQRWWSRIVVIEASRCQRVG